MPLAPKRTLRIARKALYFDGVDDYVKVPYSPSLEFSDSEGITVLLWFYPRAVVVSGAGGMILSHHVYAHQGYYIQWEWGKLRVVINGDGDTGIRTSNTVFQNNVWYCAGFRHKNGTTGVIVNGVVENEGPTRAMGTTTDIDLSIARWQDVYENCVIAYVIIYNRALGEEEIQQIYNDPDHPPKSGLVLWLHDTSIDAENNVWRDLSGKGNNATIYGATAVDVVRPAVRTQSPIRTLSPTR